ncbi:MAG: DUF87 domain-containing protein [Veillonellaceae bacterium]|nr:DUF87 domain-containing protein [Veillonellaceae bacterium]
MHNKEASNLSIGQRIITALIYLSILLLVCWALNGRSLSFFTDTSNYFNLLFISGALILILGSYVSEPYFTKPVDVISNSVAVIIALIGIKSPQSFFAYKTLLITSTGLLISSIILIFLSYFPLLSKFQRFLFKIVTKIGSAKWIFSIMYLLTLFSYFRNDPSIFLVLYSFWLFVIFKEPVEFLVDWVTKLWLFFKETKSFSEILGMAIGCENPFLYKVEIDYQKHKVPEIKKGQLVYLSLELHKGAIGIIINEKQLLNKKWITIYLLQEKHSPLKINFKTNELITDSNTIFSHDNSVHLFDIEELPENSRQQITSNYMYRNRNNFLGYVSGGSNINKIYFLSLVDPKSENHKLLKEGTVVKTNIHEQETLFQIIDGKTDEEKLENHDMYGYLIGIAQKLGYYNKESNELSTVKWLPDIFSPVFLLDVKEDTKIDTNTVGKLPQTDIELAIKDYNSLITHNTAILGILGIGKSCLTFELIQKVVNNTDVKIICIDITNEYKKELKYYIEENTLNIDSENTFNSLNNRATYIHREEPNNTINYEKSGNIQEYKAALKKDICVFLFGDETIPDNKTFEKSKRIRIFNPDYHKVTKGEKIGYGAITTDLTAAEKTRIISEEIFKILLNLGVSENQQARILLVFEEAHSLVPEWNSTANEGDKSATNGTAKIILQGRKYGLGSLIITQRTANISKSILNQCNTIFALRVFDDTGKTFLENYIGSDYANTLPTLEERHAIVVGKALKLKQPVILRLNDRDLIRKNIV